MRSAASMITKRRVAAGVRRPAAMAGGPAPTTTTATSSEEEEREAPGAGVTAAAAEAARNKRRLRDMVKRFESARSGTTRPKGTLHLDTSSTHCGGVSAAAQAQWPAPNGLAGLSNPPPGAAAPRPNVRLCA